MVNRTVDSAIEVTITTPQTISKQDNLLCIGLIEYCNRNKIAVKRTVPMSKEQYMDWRNGGSSPSLKIIED